MLDGVPGRSLVTAGEAPGGALDIGVLDLLGVLGAGVDDAPAQPATVSRLMQANVAVIFERMTPP